MDQSFHVLTVHHVVVVLKDVHAHIQPPVAVVAWATTHMVPLHV